MVIVTQLNILWNLAGEDGQLEDISFIFRCVPTTKLTEK
jgi:hypothetical protein